MAGIFAKRIWQRCICQPNELKREIKKKNEGANGGQAKNWGSMAHPGSPLESPLWNAIRIYEKRKASKKKKRKFLAVLAKTPRLNRFF